MLPKTGAPNIRQGAWFSPALEMALKSIKIMRLEMLTVLRKYKCLFKFALHVIHACTRVFLHVRKTFSPVIFSSCRVGVSSLTSAVMKLEWVVKNRNWPKLWLQVGEGLQCLLLSFLSLALYPKFICRKGWKQTQSVEIFQEMSLDSYLFSLFCNEYQYSKAALKVQT